MSEEFNDDDGWRGPDGANGAPEDNDNAVKHGLYRNKDKLMERLESHEKRFIMQMAQDLLDRVNGDVGVYERHAIRNICIDALKREWANEYFADEFDLDSERQHKTYSRLLRDTTHELEKLGLHMQNPEQEKAEAQQDWFSAMEDVSEDN